MKQFNIDKIKESLNDLEEMKAELKTELKKKQAYYANLCGKSRQDINQFLSGYRKNFRPEEMIEMYLKIQADIENA